MNSDIIYALVGIVLGSISIYDWYKNRESHDEYRGPLRLPFGIILVVMSIIGMIWFLKN